MSDDVHPRCPHCLRCDTTLVFMATWLRYLCLRCDRRFEPVPEVEPEPVDVDNPPFGTLEAD